MHSLQKLTSLTSEERDATGYNSKQAQCGFTTWAPATLKPYGANAPSDFFSVAFANEHYFLIFILCK
jgi:Mlc titration factor MtfA (ptsG expression regulator)